MATVLVLIIGATVSVILLMIALIHIYWAFSKNTPSAKVIPYINGFPAFVPSRLVTSLVAIILLLVGVTTFELSFHIVELLPSWFMKFLGSSIALGFLLRAIGDFRLLGFFKTIRDSEFAFYDNKFWSPLCVLLGISILFITWA